MRMNRRHFITATGAALMVGGRASAAESLVRQPVRIIVPASPGGFTDIAARVLAEKLGTNIGQSVVVDNRPGASGMIGAEAAARSTPDGTTLVMGSIQSHGVNPGLFKSMSYDVMKDFAPVTRVAMGYTVLVVPSSSPIRTLQGLVEQAKKQPGVLTYGSGGAGASSHLCAEMLKQSADINVLHVPFKGTAPALQGLIGGQVSMLFDTIPSALPHVKSGALRALAVTSATRLASLPDVPAVAELLPGFEMAVWVGIYAPAGTPARIVDGFDREIQSILKESALVQRFEQLGFAVQPIGPREFGAFTRAEIAKWGEVIRKGRITVE